MEFSTDQSIAWERLVAFANSGRQTMTFAGLAGTGKTTVAQHFGRYLSDRAKTVVYCAPTGKAASVLRSKGAPAVTLCSLLYTFRGTKESLDGKEIPIFDVKGEQVDDDIDLLIIDEASMVNQKDYNGACRRGWRMLFVGDHGQLKPIGGDPGIMRRPQIALEKIHRQAEDSSILKAAYHVRQGKPLKYGKLGDFSYKPITGSNPHYQVARRCIDHDIMICGYNRTRISLNKAARELRGYSGPPVAGEPLVCRLNDHAHQWMNGEVYTIEYVSGTYDRFYLVKLTDLPYEIPIWRQPIDEPTTDVKTSERDIGLTYAEYGYAITGHSSQGSEWKRVGIVDEPVDDANRWRYTTFTRAQETCDVFDLP